MPERGTLGIEKARRLLGYVPEVPIEVGVPRYIEWYERLDVRGGGEAARLEA
jgi:nucleoside-diphosphate-sugar epimerase